MISSIRLQWIRKKNLQKQLKDSSGATLVEVLFALSILAVVITGLLQVFITSSTLTSLSGSLTAAVTEAQGKIDEIRNHPFDDVFTDYDDDIFPLSLLDGWGFVWVDDTDPDLLDIEVSIAWTDKNGRIIGEDVDFDGVYSVGKDTNGDGELNYPVTFKTFIANK